MSRWIWHVKFLKRKRAAAAPPDGDYTPKLDFSDARNSQYIGLF